MMSTVVIQIGNSDDKLSQASWNKYVEGVRERLKAQIAEIHFDGSSPGDAPWQNHCFVAELEDVGLLRIELKWLACSFDQESVALIVCKEVEFAMAADENWNTKEEARACTNQTSNPASDS